ncbi:hypothetical protein KS18_05945 [Photorhabdus luminescens]|nr:hypothetical protein KS18_05945 [Photorhabdus luminescens]
MKKNYVISSQIMNTIEVFNKPWGIQDSSSDFIYDNSATKEFIRNFKQSFDYGEFYDHELP